MRVHMQLVIDGNIVKLEDLEIDDRKLEELNEHEIEEVIEILIRSWVDKTVQVEWEIEKK